MRIKTPYGDKNWAYIKQCMDNHDKLVKVCNIFCQYMEENDDYCCSEEEREYCSKEKQHNNPYFMAKEVLNNLKNIHQLTLMEQQGE